MQDLPLLYKMNAILSLCHFCELHGPSVVFCTQAFRDLPDISVFCDMEAVDILDQRPIATETEKVMISYRSEQEYSYHTY